MTVTWKSRCPHLINLTSWVPGEASRPTCLRSSGDVSTFAFDMEFRNVRLQGNIRQAKRDLRYAGSETSVA